MLFDKRRNVSENIDMDTHTCGTTRRWERPLHTFRFIHAMTGESMVALLDRLTKQELER